MVGDFNSPLYPSEKSGSLVDYSNSMADLEFFLSSTSLIDIDLSSQAFTWTNRCLGEDMIQVRSNRFLCSSNWTDLLSATLQALPTTVSNYNPLLLISNDHYVVGLLPF